MSPAGDRTERPERSERPTDETLFHVAFESSPSGVIVVDARGRIVLVNGETERIFGYPRAELVGQSIQQLVPEDLRTSHARTHEAFPAP